MHIQFWTGEKNRSGHFYAPCSCGCDQGKIGKTERTFVGYYSRSDSHGNGLTIYYETEEELNAARVAIDAVMPDDE